MAAWMLWPRGMSWASKAEQSEAILTSSETPPHHSGSAWTTPRREGSVVAPSGRRNVCRGRPGSRRNGGARQSSRACRHGRAPQSSATQTARRVWPSRWCSFDPNSKARARVTIRTVHLIPEGSTTIAAFVSTGPYKPETASVVMRRYSAVTLARAVGERAVAIPLGPQGIVDVQRVDPALRCPSRRMTSTIRGLLSF